VAADGGLSGSNIVVTGGASGLGLEVVRRLVGEGAAVVVLDRDREALARLSDIDTGPGRVWGHCVDVTDPSALRRVARRLGDELGAVYGIFNNAGIQGRATHWAEPESPASLELPDTLEVNLHAPYLVVRIFLDLMRVGGGGVVVNTASVTALRGSPAYPWYAASKAGLIALSQSMALALGRYGVRVHCICPSSLGDTSLRRNSTGRDPTPEQLMSLMKKTALGRLPGSGPVAALVLTLMDPDFAGATNTVTIFDQP